MNILSSLSEYLCITLVALVGLTVFVIWLRER